jgi:hypothetical protein
MMMVYGKTWLMSSTAADRKRIANYGTWLGKGPDRYFRRCAALHQPTGTVMVFSRDEGHHTSGWWKNPDYERCLHLSLSFTDPTSGQIAPRDKKLTQEWLRHFFGAQALKLWCEPPYSAMGKARETWHYRLFCTPAWTPIVPRGEVYSRELTEAGWLSYSDHQAALAAEAERQHVMSQESR